MKGVAPVAEILHETDGKSPVNQQEHSPFSTGQGHGVPVKEGKSSLAVHLTFIEGSPAQ